MYEYRCLGQLPNGNVAYSHWMDIESLLWNLNDYKNAGIKILRIEERKGEEE